MEHGTKETLIAEHRNDTCSHIWIGLSWTL